MMQLIPSKSALADMKKLIVGVTTIAELTEEKIRWCIKDMDDRAGLTCLFCCALFCFEYLNKKSAFAEM